VVAEGLGGSDPPPRTALTPSELIGVPPRRPAAPRFGCGWARKFERWMGCQRALLRSAAPSGVIKSAATLVFISHSRQVGGWHPEFLTAPPSTSRNAP
jgi:hypothetical protein